MDGEGMNINEWGDMGMVGAVGMGVGDGDWEIW